MKIIINKFVDSAKEFKKLESIVTVALLIALHTVMAMTLSIQITPSMRISISFVVNCITAFMYGPVVGMVAAGLGDIIQFLLKPVGPYFVGWTISASLAGLIYGLAFFKSTGIKKIQNNTKKHLVDVDLLVRCIVGLTIQTLLVNVLLGTYWVNCMFGKGFGFYFTARLSKNIIQLPINIVITYYVITVIKKIKIRK